MSERTETTLKKMRRHDDRDTSTIFCRCGASFTWEAWSDDLDPFLEAHAEHVIDEHTPTCGWHRDWHECDCGAHNAPKTT